MRQLEGLLGILAGLLFAATGVLGVMWIGVAAYMSATGATGNAQEQVADVSGEAGQGVASVAATTGAGAAPAQDPSSAGGDGQDSSAADAGAVNAGVKAFKKCKACHSAEAGAKNKSGPNLWNVVDRPVASIEGFVYSPAMKEKAGETWSVAALGEFLGNPKKTVPGTKMSFAGLKREEDIAHVILFLAQRSDTPRDAEALGLATVAAAPAADPGDAPAAEAGGGIDPVPYPEGVSYRNSPARTAQEQADVAERVAALAAIAPSLDYERARFHPSHFPPAVAAASNEECLVCHQEILDNKPREMSPAGVPAESTMAWYQTLDTYQGAQESFHYRHLQSDFARSVMKLDCTFCHKGNDPREESPDVMRGRPAFGASSSPEFTLRKAVNPSTTCLRCHGAMPDPVGIMGLEGPWPQVRADLEYPEAPNGCLGCHAEGFRTVRHDVSYLNAANIERLAREGSSDTCYGCHGGRQWYRISYPYPRHPWPDMDPETPEWAHDRPTVSDPEYALPAPE